LLPAAYRIPRAIGIGLCLALLPWGLAFRAATVCVLTPRLALGARGEAVAAVPLPAPTLLSTDSLEELRIERGGELLWRRQAEEDAPIEGPVPWPLPPLRPGERLVLMLRPTGVPQGEYAVIVLQGDPAERMRWAQAELERLGKNATAWWRAIREAFDREDLSLGLALLFAFEGPSAPRLDNLRREVFLAGCGETGGGLNVAPYRPRTASRILPGPRAGAADILRRTGVADILHGTEGRDPGG
jgi:hypothetical protein